MLKKFIAVFFVLMIAVCPVYANPLDELDNREETESAAGITWDEINEMAQNSPNSLGPLQGLMLWMFAIIAFLKLAQKLDSMLQSLGLNVTQTGGRALGDLVMAGMALKNIGGAVSRGMGMLGVGGGGSSGSSGGSGSSGNASSMGSSSIPTGGAGSNPSSPRGSLGGGVPMGGMQSNGNSQSKNPAAGTPPNAASPSGTDASNTYSGNEASGEKNSVESSDSQTSVSNSADQPDGGSFAKGAIKAGLKGGLVGLGVYSAKTGAGKIGEAMAARSAENGTTVGVSEDLPDDNRFHNNNENPENFRDAMPLDCSEGQSVIPTSINNEEFQPANPPETASDSPSEYLHFNDEGYNDVVPDSRDTGNQAIPVSPSSESDADEGWHYSDSVETSGETNDGTPIPASVNNEEWHSENLSPEASATITGGEVQEIPPLHQNSETVQTSDNVPGIEVSDSSQISQSAETEIKDGSIISQNDFVEPLNQTAPETAPNSENSSVQNVTPSTHEIAPIENDTTHAPTPISTSNQSAPHEIPQASTTSQEISQPAPVANPTVPSISNTIPQTQVENVTVTNYTAGNELITPTPQSTPQPPSPIAQPLSSSLQINPSNSVPNQGTTTGETTVPGTTKQHAFIRGFEKGSRKK